MDSFSQHLLNEVRRRRTFAIIAHPDAGKTTLTEKLLLYGGAIHLAGSVKQKRASRHTTSDWMELERERGISISTSIMQFEHRGCHINLLDTPGHNDFSEDTYRTLSAVDSAVMLIDSVKGVEPQTIKLCKVCRLRRIPIATFINKMDRSGREPLDLLEEIEKVLGIPCAPLTWPIGGGPTFQGLYDRERRQLLRFHRTEAGARKARQDVASLEDDDLREAIGTSAHRQLLEELALLEGAGNGFEQERFLSGDVTPVFFGSAMNNFGVEPFLDRYVDLAPAPRPRATHGGIIAPDSENFSGFVFKIQANMDPLHRDRIAFVRVTSGRFQRGMEVVHGRARPRTPPAHSPPLNFSAEPIAGSGLEVRQLPATHDQESALPDDHQQWRGPASTQTSSSTAPIRARCSTAKDGPSRSSQTSGPCRARRRRTRSSPSWPPFNPRAQRGQRPREAP